MLPIALVHGRGDIWIVYVVIFLYGVTGSVIKAAQNALVPALVPPGLLAEANGAQQTLNQGLQLVTPLIGAGLFTVVGGAGDRGDRRGNVPGRRRIAAPAADGAGF